MKLQIKYVAALVFSILGFSINGRADNYKYSLLSCIDCFNFVAPTVFGAENVASPEVGLIILDSANGTFRGFSGTGGWVKLSNDTAIQSYLSSVQTTVNVTAADDVIVVDASAFNVTVNLPSAITYKGKQLTIKKSDSSSNVVTIDPNGSEMIDGSFTRNMVVGSEVLTIISNGAAWIIINNQRPHIGAKYCATGYAFAPGTASTFILSQKAYDTDVGPKNRST